MCREIGNRPHYSPYMSLTVINILIYQHGHIQFQNLSCRRNFLVWRLVINVGCSCLNISSDACARPLLKYKLAHCF